jgi:UDP-N-acetylglucosamine 2-epimerase (non-hydrolysing)
MTSPTPNSAPEGLRKVAIVIGTRPEAIKMAPVVRALRKSKRLQPFVISTGQQRELVRQAFASVGLEPDVDLDLMRPNQGLALLTGRVLEAVNGVLAANPCVACLVHGDTTSALSGALAAFYARLPIGHVEAGLRTYDFDRPWPEEMNRRLIDPLCRWCFAPTSLSGENLRREGIPSAHIHQTGNTVIDALLDCRARQQSTARPAATAERMVLVTGHRRESFGDGFIKICEALRALVEARPEVRVIYPVHLNPNVREPVYRLLGNHPRIQLQEPVDYEAFVALMDSSHFILTDSGGVQEEAPSLGKPVLVMRDTTERPEGIDAGTCVLVGTDPARILAESLRLLNEPEEYARRSSLRNPYGDGQASARIAAILEKDLS